MDPLYTLFCFIFGAIIGSFLNVVILRLPEDTSIVFPPSRCPKCQTLIRWYDNLPIVSFLLLRGRCRACRSAISLQYPLVELAMGLLTLALFHKFALSFEFFFYFAFVAGLVAIIFIDLQQQIIPDLISLPGILLGFGGSFFTHELSWQASGIGLLVGGGFLYCFALGYYLLTKREGMGGGDIKLLGMIGAFLGWQSLLFVIFASSLTGSIVGLAVMGTQGKGGQTRIPFGPFLAVAALVYLFFHEHILRYWQDYLTLIR